MTVLERHVETAAEAAEDLRWFRWYLQGLLDAGTTKTELERALRHVHEHLTDREDGEKAADLVLDGLDILVGWCAPHMRLNS